MSSLPRAVLWDMDGTLLDSEKLWDVAMADLAAKLGATMTQELRQSTLGNSMTNALNRLFDAAGHEVASASSDTDGNFVLKGQLATQDGMTIVVGPKPGSGGWMQGQMWCKFTDGTDGPFGLQSGEETFVGDLQLPRSDDPDQPATCRS